jgi:hypothetical protein
MDHSPQCLDHCGNGGDGRGDWFRDSTGAHQHRPDGAVRRGKANLGRLVPMEIVVRFDRESLRRYSGTAADNARPNMLERMEIVQGVQRAIEKEFGPKGRDLISRPMSAITFVPPWPRPSGSTGDLIQRNFTNDRFEEAWNSLRDTGYLTRTREGDELWRVSVRVAAFRNVDYGRFDKELRRIVEPLVARANADISLRASTAIENPESAAGNAPARAAVRSAPEQTVSTVYTGVIPIVYKAQRELLNSLIESTFWSFLTITPLMMIVARGVAGGFVAMLPNILPVVAVFGGMGWLGLPVDIGSMMSASIALGVAVDDTIHYLTWFRESLNRHGDRRRAILDAYRRCATPTLQAALINGLGLSVFALGSFIPTRNFGLLMLVILMAGVVAELVLLPALLASPLGMVFRPAKRGTVTPPLPATEGAADAPGTVPVPTVQFRRRLRKAEEESASNRRKSRRSSA